MFCLMIGKNSSNEVLVALAVAKPVAIHHRGQRDAVGGKLVTPRRIGEVDGRGPAGHAAEDPHRRSVGILVALVTAKCREGQLRKKIHQRLVAVERAGDALESAGSRGGIRSCRTTRPPHAPRPASGGFAWAHIPVSVIRCKTFTSDSRSHTGQLFLGVHDLLPRQYAFQQRLVIPGENLGGLTGAGVVPGVHVGEGVRCAGPVVAAGIPGWCMPGEHEPHHAAFARRQRKVEGC